MLLATMLDQKTIYTPMTLIIKTNNVVYTKILENQ